VSDEGYDRALVCRKGHPINPSAGNLPQHNKAFCDKCGAPAVEKCASCQQPIQGYYWGSLSIDAYKPPSHCHNCGKPFPWTEARLRSISELLAMSGVSAADQAALRDSVADLVAESPGTPVAIAKWRKYLAGTGKQLLDSFRELLVDVAAEAVNRKLFGP